jgi:hypothetical protein
MSETNKIVCAIRTAGITLGMYAWMNCVYAYLPEYKYIQGDSIHRANEINPLLPSHYIVNEDKDVMIDGELYDAKEVYALGGPIRYYYARIMPRIKGEPLFSNLDAAAITWRDKHMPLKVPGQINKVVTKSDKEAKASQEQFIQLLDKHRNEICRLYNEYMRNSLDIKDLQQLCSQWRKVASSRCWKELKGSKTGREKAEQELTKLLDQGRDFDTSIAKAYSPIIDVRLERYKKHMSEKGTAVAGEDVHEEITKARREASKARREARDAREAAEAAEIRAEDARRRNWAWSNDPMNPINNPDNPQNQALTEAILIKMRRAEKQRARERLR